MSKFIVIALKQSQKVRLMELIWRIKNALKFLIISYIIYIYITVTKVKINA